MGAYNVAGRYGEWGDRPHPEQGFRACLGIVRLTKPFGAGRVEPAAMRALEGSVKPVCQYVRRMLICRRTRTSSRFRTAKKIG